MNERQPYEHRLAEKLQQLPSPDVETSWQQMKRLLDDNQQPKAGGSGKGPGGWWRTGLIAIVVMTGLWLYTENKKSPGKEMAIAKQQNTESKTPASNSVNILENNNATASNTANKNQLTTNDNTVTLKSNSVNTEKENKTGTESHSHDTNQSLTNNTKQKFVADKSIAFIPGNDRNANSVQSKNIKTDGFANSSKSFEPADKKEKNVKDLVASSSTSPDVSSTVTDKKLANKNATPAIMNNKIKDVQQNDIAGNKTLHYKTNAHRTKPTLLKEVDNNIDAAGFSEVKPDRSNAFKQQKNNDFKEKSNSTLTYNSGISDEKLLVKQKAGNESLLELSVINNPAVINTFLAVGDSIEAEVDGNALLSKETKEQSLRAKRAYEAEAMAKKEKKSLHLNLSNLFKPFSLHIDAEPWWAAGFALNNSVAVNAQNRYNYNINAKSGVLGDYIPSPYVQFHLNDYVYMQTELNLSTPQLTPQLLLYQKSAEVASAAGFSQQKSIYVQKLYYFNWPVSLHYSPINNLYFAAGLQFSSFQSGLALIQNKRYATQSGSPNNPVSIENSIQKFKDDSLAAKLSPTEWRWQTGADYYWNRFTIGLRYNKSFKDLLNVNVTSSLPLTTNRNSAFLFFMRYNLFEGRNKNNSGPKGSLVRY